MIFIGFIAAKAGISRPALPLYNPEVLLHIPRPMAIVTTLLISLLVLVCLLMVLLILMQRPKQEGLGAAFGGGMTDSMFGAQTTDVLQKGTTYLAVAFFVICIALAAIKTRQFEANATKGEGLIEATEPVIDPIPQIPDLGAPAVDPLIPLPGGDDDTAASDSIETPAPAAAKEETSPSAPGDDAKPAAAEAKPKADASKPAAKPEPKPNADTKPADTEPAAPKAAAKPAPTPADTKPKPDSGNDAAN